MAIDGDADGNFGDGSVWYGNSPSSEGTNTNPSTTYNYTVNLGQNDYIDRVQFLPRTDADQSIFGNFNISVYQGVPGPGNSVVPAATPSFSENYNSSYFGDTFATADPGNSANGGNASGSYGQFVSITRLDNNYWMTFSEMQVVGSPVPMQDTISNDLALNKPVTASSPAGYGGSLSGGNDGNISGDLSAPSAPDYCSSTAGVGQYWQVDLGGNTPLSTAELFCRNNVGENTTSQFDVEVFNSAMQMVDSVIVNNNNAAGNFDHEINLSGITGEYLRLVTTQNQNLCFSELEVFGTSQTQQWASTSSGDWNNIDNWNGGTAPNAVGAEADFFGAISSNHTVTTDAPVTVGTLNFNNANTYQIAGTGSLTLQSSSGNAQIIVQNGTQELNIPTTIASNTTLNVASGATLIIANPVTINSGESLTQTGTGTVTYQSIITVNSNGAIAFADSTHAHELSLASGATATLGGPVLEVDSISNLGTINIENNKLLVNYGSGPDPIASIAAWIKNGFYDLAGPQIISSDIAAADAASGLSYGIGYADSADPGNPANLPSGTIEVMFTLLGDANLDGTVNSEDFTLFSEHLGQSGQMWDDGDFNSDGTVNTEDFTLFSHNLGESASLAGGALEANGLSLANVPEPMSAGMMAMAGLGILRRRRRLR
jgi:hypothetical protein